MTCHPNAKINLGLNVTERRPDGYHNIETVFYPIPLCDTLQLATDEEANGRPPFAENAAGIHAADGYTLYTQGNDVGCPPESNLVIKALRALKADFDIARVHIYINKKIPSGAGLGGGSSDAACMMVALNRMFALGMDDDELERRVSPLGADCAFFVRNRPVFATGIGNEFTPISLTLAGWYLVLVKPDVFVSTKEAYAQIKARRPATPVTEIICRPVDEWKDTLTNDFEEGVFAQHPEIADIKQKLYDFGAVYASMSGSGSSVFGLFRQRQNDAAMQKAFAGSFYRQDRL